MAKRGKIRGYESIDEIVRPERIKKYKYLILIICEDQNTEKKYFNNFRSRVPLETIFLKAVGTGRDPKGVMEQAIQERNNLAVDRRREVDEVWVVFDKDDADKEEGKTKRFHEAMAICEDEKFNLAFSNEVFELWLLLHLTDIDPAIALPRNVIYSKLEELVKLNKGHGDYTYIHGSNEILEKIAAIGDEQKAIQRAVALINFHKNKPFLECNPVTYVHTLILNLYEWIQYFSY